MSQDNELSNIIRDLEKIENSANEFPDEEWSDLHGRIIQLPRTDRRQLYKVKEYVPLEEVLDWQQTCPPDKRITDAGTNSEEDIRIAFEINKRVAIWTGRAQTIECDTLLLPLYRVYITSGFTTRSGRFTIYRDCRSPVKYIYSTSKPRTDEGPVIEFLTLATLSGCRSLVIDLDTFYLEVADSFAIALIIMAAVKRWLEQNYNLVDKIILCARRDSLYNRLLQLMQTRFPVYEVNIPESKFPVEILLKGSRAIQIYTKAVSDGKHAVQNIRVMLVGQSGVGKTTLLKRLLDQRVKIKKIESTEGIDVHVHRCKIDVDSGQWHCQGSLNASSIPLLPL